MKRVVLLLLFSVFAMCLMNGCGNGNKEEEPITAIVSPVPTEAVIEEPETEPSEEITEEELEPVEEIEEEAEEKDLTYVQLYLQQINELYNRSKADQFALVYIDEDDIPELVATYSKGYPEYDYEDPDTVFLYSVYDDAICVLRSGLVGMYGCSLSYSEKNNIVYETGGDVYFGLCIEKIDKGQLVELLSMTIDSYYDDSTGEVNDSFFINEEEVTEQECIQRIAEYTSQCNPFTEVDYDCLHTVQFSDADIYAREDVGTMPYMSYEEITDYLRDLLMAGVDFKNDDEPWKEAYANYLYDIMAGKEDLSDYHEVVFYVQGAARFNIFDITGDGIPELFVSPGQDPWSAYKYENDELVPFFLGYLEGYNPDKKELYENDGSPWGGYCVYGIEDGKTIYKYAFGEGDPEPPACPYYYEDSEHNLHEITKEELDNYYTEMDLDNHRITGIEFTKENVDKELKK